MPQPPAAVGPRFLSEGALLALKRLTGTLLVSGLLYACPVLAQDIASGQERYLVDIELQTAEEFGQMLQRAEKLLIDGVATQEGNARVTFLMHGPEVRILLRENYLENKEIVDLAASLSALGVVDIKACQTWMGGNGVNEEELQPFVETVPYAPAELDRLVKEQNYINF